MPPAGRFVGRVRLAVTLLTVVRVSTRDEPEAPSRADAGIAMTLAPVVGALLGAAMAAVGIGSRALGATAFIAAVLTVALGAGLTRGLHLDGLADTMDGLGAYPPRAAALAAMRTPDIGAFGTVATVLVVLAQTGALAAVLERPWWAAAAGIGAGAVAGRVAIAGGCRRGVPAARPDGLGALVAGTVPPVAPPIGAILAAAIGAFAVPGRPAQGIVAVLLGLAAAAALGRHAVRRFGGVTGDVLGALCEVTATVTYLVVSI